MNDNASMIVVLCSTLCSNGCQPFEPAEWSKLADSMIAHNLQPKDIPDLSDEDMRQLFGYGTKETERVKKLLNRAGSLGFELESLSSKGIKIVTRADKGYPRVLMTKLKGNCPPLLYYVGELSLLDRKAVGFVGSKDAGEEDAAFTERIVEKVNKRGFGVVSGGSGAVDNAAYEASVSNGSFCIKYISDALIQKMRKRDVLFAIQDKALLLLSAAKPDAPFNADVAMQRNNFIFAQSKATVVVKSDYKKGSTWNGAVQALEKEYCPVFCRDHKQYKGNAELIKLGAVPIDDSRDGDVDNLGSFGSGEFEQLSLFDE